MADEQTLSDPSYSHPEPDCDACHRWPARVRISADCSLCRVCAAQALAIEEAGGDAHELVEVNE